MLTSTCRNNANDNMLMTISKIAVSRNTQSLTSCHYTVISNNTYGNSVFANTTGVIINTTSDNMLTSATPTKLSDDVHTTSSEAEASNLTHILISYDKTHAFNGTSSDNLPSWYIHNFMEFVQLRRGDTTSVINLIDYPLTVPKLCVLSRGLMFTPLPQSVGRLSLGESIAMFERRLRQAVLFNETNNSDYDN